MQRRALVKIANVMRVVWQGNMQASAHSMICPAPPWTQRKSDTFHTHSQGLDAKEQEHEHAHKLANGHTALERIRHLRAQCSVQRNAAAG
jgi:hypothetical protein